MYKQSYITRPLYLAAITERCMTKTISKNNVRTFNA